MASSSPHGNGFSPSHGTIILMKGPDADFQLIADASWDMMAQPWDMMAQGVTAGRL